MSPANEINPRLWTDQLLKAMIGADRPGAAQVIDQAIAEGLGDDVLPEQFVDTLQAAVRPTQEALS